MHSQLLAPELKPLIVSSRIHWMIIAAGLFYVAEGIAVMPVPWLRLGLSNVFVLIAARHLEWKSALLVAWGKTILGSLATGQFLSPIFLINLSGTTVAALIMGGLGRATFLSMIGISILAAWGHVWGQLVAAGLLWGDPVPIMGLAPFLLGMALVTGPLVGWLAEKADVSLNNA